MKKGLIICCIVGLFSSCYNDKGDKLYPAPIIITNSCDTTTITYAHDIAPIINTYCNNCHNTGGSGAGFGDFSTCSGVQTVANNGSLLTDINFTPTSRHQSMPQGGTKLSDCNINKITRWVHLGAQNN